MKSSTFFFSLVGSLIIAGLAACGSGGGGGGGSGGGGAAAGSGSSAVVGTIAGFGSIIMDNGVEYETDDVATCEVDDLDAPGICEDSLAVGMRISMSVDASGSVTSVHYDDELEGPATNVSGSDGNFSFEVFGVEVVTTNPGTEWDGFTTDPPSLAELDGANVEVSGEWLLGLLNATYVEMQDDATHEAKGTVGIVVGFMFPLTLEDGTVINVDATGANLVPLEGDYVEVEGNFDGVIFNATDVEFEDEDDIDSDIDSDGDGDIEVEITGTLVVAEGSLIGSIGSTAVDISNAPSCTDLVGSKVEAEGSYDVVTGVLLVEECEAEEDELEMKCLTGIVTVDLSMPKVGSVECTFPGTTGGPLLVVFRDSPELALFSDDTWSNPFDLRDVHEGDCVEIEATTDALGAHVAGLLELEEVATGCDSYKLEGPVSAFTESGIITVLGVTFTTVATSYPDGLPEVDDTVEITDTDGDGNADSVEIDD